MKSNIGLAGMGRRSPKEEAGSCYISRPGMEHRIHEDSTTSGLLAAKEAPGGRTFRYCGNSGLHGRAGLIEHFYQKSEKSNQL